MKTKLIISVILMAIFTIPLSATTFYVNHTTGNDLNNGLFPAFTTGINGPKKTIQAAVNLAKNLDTIFISPGLYAESIIIDSQLVVIGSGSQNDTINNTVVQAPVSGNGNGITINKGGISATSRFYISNILVRNFSN